MVGKNTKCCTDKLAKKLQINMMKDNRKVQFKNQTQNLLAARPQCKTLHQPSPRKLWEKIAEGGEDERRDRDHKRNYLHASFVVWQNCRAFEDLSAPMM